MSLTATAKYIPPARIAIVTASDGRRCTMGNVATEAEVQAAIDFAVARWEAADAAEAERKAERQRAISAEGVAQAVAKAAATPKALSFLTFLRVIQYKETCPYFDEIRSELDRLAANGKGGH